MKSNAAKWLFLLLLRYVGIISILLMARNAMAEYYVVYPTEVVGSIPVVVEQPRQCIIKRPTCHHHHKRRIRYHKTSHVAVSVYYIYNSPCCGQCGYNNCYQTVMPACRGCGYNVYYGSPVQHSDVYYMRGFNEDDNDPVIDGNTYDNDIYY